MLNNVLINNPWHKGNFKNIEMKIQRQNLGDAAVV